MRSWVGRILDAFPNMKVDVHHPEILIHVELRESGKIFIYSKIIPGPGGYAGRHEWKGNAAALRRHRQPSGRLYDLQAWCKAGCDLLSCAAIYERACEAEGH
ncbi:MAG: THUMP domain-containing protein [Lachnospiraceae bacterium]